MSELLSSKIILNRVTDLRDHSGNVEFYKTVSA